MANLSVRQTRSPIGRTKNQRDTLRTLGLKRIGDVAVREDNPQVRGMIASISHLVDVETTDEKVES